jgi:hypothetical protein
MEAQARVGAMEARLGGGGGSPPRAIERRTSREEIFADMQHAELTQHQRDIYGGGTGVGESHSRERRKSIDMKNQLRMDRQGSIGGVGGGGSFDHQQSSGGERRKSIDMKNELRMQRQGSVTAGVYTGGGFAQRDSPRESAGGGESGERRRSIDKKNQLRMERQGSVTVGGGTEPGGVSRRSIERRKSIDMKFAEKKAERRGSAVFS